MGGGAAGGGAGGSKKLQHRNLWEEARDAGCLVRTNGGGDAAPVHEVDVAGFSASIVDLTNEEAREWVVRTILRGEMLERTGAVGWMADFGEALPCDGVQLHDGRAACAYHNRYALDWADLNR